MIPRGDEPHLRGKKGKSTLQEKVAVFYYTLGLFCITYPVCVLCFASVIIIISWLPLVNVSFPGKAPQVWTADFNNTEEVQQPFCYVQQIVLRVAVLPWKADLTLGDAFRAPIYEAFKLLDVVRNYQDQKSLKNLGHVCLHIEAIKRTNDRSNILPQYNCLVLSPANLWDQDIQQFSQDSSILSTIFNYHSFQKGKTSVSDMVFGMHLFDTGIKRYPMRSRPRIIQYALTIFFKDFDSEFIEGLRDKLTTLYPLYQNASSSFNYKLNDTVLIKYPGEINYVEVVPLVIAFGLLFLYYYFSVRKIEIIKSKLGMAFTATFTIFCNLTMTMGICFFFGLTLNSDGGKGIIPYLTLLVGLENVLVLTKSVVATPLHLDVKIRNAQGLSNEGWSITKNLLLEITVLTFGLFTFIPEIQEFSIFSIVALITDFFLQMFFFLTILGLDMNRMSHAIEKMSQKLRNNLYQQQSFFDKPFTGVKGMVRSKSHPRLTNFPSNIVVAPQGPQEKKIPKRVKLVNIWASTRIFQRSFMLLMLMYIFLIIYKSDIMNQFLRKTVDKPVENSTIMHFESVPTVNRYPISTPDYPVSINYVTYSPLEQYTQNQTQGIEKLKHPDYTPWLKLPSRHWSAILRKYNVSISGQVIALLPNIKLSHVVRPEQAVILRNPNEKYGDTFQWQALAVALDPIDFSDETAGHSIPQSDQPFYPTSPMEIFLTTILCFISVVVLAYGVFVLYRCICSRNYAEWRASWFNDKVEEQQENQVLLEAMPIGLEVHSQEIECIATDGTNIVSACLGGQIKVFDNNTTEVISQIDRKSLFTDARSSDLASELDETLSDYESGSPPSREDSFPKLLNRINTDFSNTTDDHWDPTEYTDSKYNFNKSYRHFYYNHNFGTRLRNRYESLKGETAKRHSMENIAKRRSLNNGDDGEVRTKSNVTYSRSSSGGDSKSNTPCESGESSNFSGLKCKLSPIWCMDYLDNLIVIGCADGRLEFWEASSGDLKCIFEDGVESGINHLKIVGAKVIAVRLCGLIELLQLQTYNQGRPIDWNFTCAYRRMHVRTASAGSISEQDLKKPGNNEDDLRVIKIHSSKAHQQPITCLDCEGGRILTGSQDHTLKVLRLEDGNPVYTLHGHCGPITCLFIDRVNPATSGSGSQDGMLCVWDLLTGACMYSIQAHDGSITSLTYSESYVISLGTDERLCVWERFQGHLLNTIHVSQTFSSQVLMLAQHLVVTARSGGLIIWDVRTGDCVRTITLGRGPFVFINQLVLLRDAVLCDYGKQLMIVRFPLMTHKFD
ncbi:sterol regulatory element-binding protein cleavage-activating protein isoform X1 [Diabrotica virgifera virgifera]|uniref:Sterol regulatory element-binding protein cleavage-activating protein n=3 Tax=Diabrotica virgifera virgifera TaxID=50390 RepID=A0ABM5KUF9_DIAVI|nr:sterol regulatory element-binding protein cleavage-activating protein isoform X1 [Diabrotica virgifera virgifera]XP_050513825.1 sterol regulatory element-binding protein cleavage-activating protein isoform X1 [Diabrotica virgifera virgifera]XP_050513826.1 sterol regulatory element-binding protein cleavage-activating protein isoform X1 [Diabrotica virgifera virgifera]XP_050513828.1 sterol regulatory element-binding protein cleavage-activating protein isoform X1 [Diabrotica virgifera virgifera]